MSSSVLTLSARQRQMKEFLDNSKNYRFIAIGKQTPWEDDNNPPEPDETMTELQELIGLQRVDYYKYAKVIPNPTSLQKRTGIYYKGLYYSVTQNLDLAIQEGFTDVIIGCTLDRDTVSAIPVGVTYRQIGLYDSVNASSSEVQNGITAEQWNNKPITDKGTLVIVENRGPISRANDQTEEIILCISF